MTRNLDLTIEMTSAETFDLTILDLDSSDQITIPCHISGDSIEEENKKIINEIRSWPELMADEYEEDEEDG